MVDTGCAFVDVKVFRFYVGLTGQEGEEEVLQDVAVCVVIADGIYFRAVARRKDDSFL